MNDQIRFTGDQFHLIKELEALAVRPPDHSDDALMDSLYAAMELIKNAHPKNDLSHAKALVSDILLYLESRQNGGTI